MSKEGVQRTRASSKPEILHATADADPTLRFDRKRAESAENVGRIHRRDRSHNSEGVASSRQIDNAPLQRQGSPQLRRPSGTFRASTDDQDAPIGAHGIARIRRSHSETRVANHAQGLGKSPDPRSHSQADPGMPQYERSTSDQSGQDKIGRAHV